MVIGKKTTTGQTLEEVSSSVARRLSRKLHGKWSETELTERAYTLALNTINDVDSTTSCPLVSWMRTDYLTDYDSLVCALDRIVTLNACGFYYFDGTSHYPQVLGYWEFRDQN